MRSVKWIFVVMLAGLVSACGGTKNEGLLDLRTNTAGPDEFGILPSKQLVIPDDLTTLPTPTTAGNRADPTPQADAIAALGGNVAARGGGVDGGIVNHTSRYGVQADIREVLAADDAKFRKNRTRFGNKRTDQYFKAYKKFFLDQYAELVRFRAAGVQTPSAPPNPK